MKAKQIGNIESIKFDIKDGDFVKLITAKDLQDYNIKNNFQPENEADEKFVEEIVCSKEGFSSVFSLLIISESNYYPRIKCNNPVQSRFFISINLLP